MKADSIAYLDTEEDPADQAAAQYRQTMKSLETDKELMRIYDARQRMPEVSFGDFLRLPWI
jgi:hypothetical protein